MTDAKFIVAVLGNRDIVTEEEMTREFEEARKWIADRYSELKRTNGFMESERQAKVEWLTAYLSQWYIWRSE